MIILFVLVACLPSVLSLEQQPAALAMRNGTIKVDDDGNGDYTTIAAALANATTGDIIEVYSGMYNETNLKVNKTLVIRGIPEELGPNGDATGKPVVNGNNIGSIFMLEANGVEISGFVILDSGTLSTDAGIRIWGNYDNHLIVDNNISYCFMGIIFNLGAENTTVRGNILKNNDKIGINCGPTAGGNIIYYNCFYKNQSTFTAYSSSPTGNTWTLNGVGNWWSDYTGIDANQDGVGDTPYEIAGSSDEFDAAPLMWQPPDYDTPAVKLTQPKERSIYLFGNYIMQRFFNISKPLIIGSINITVNATDSKSGIAKVDFYIDGVLNGTDTIAPYTFTWTEQIKLLGNHTHTVKVIAYDRGANTDSDEIVVAKFF